MDSPKSHRSPKIPRKIHLDDKLYRMPGYVYFITTRADRGRRFFVDRFFNMEIIECLKSERDRLNMKLYVYCLMPDHLHFLTGISSPNISVFDFVNQFKGKSTRIGWKYDAGNVLWQRRNYDHIVRKSEQLEAIASYILANPVRKGLVKHWQEYRYGGLLDELPVW